MKEVTMPLPITVKRIVAIVTRGAITMENLWELNNYEVQKSIEKPFYKQKKNIGPNLKTKM